MILIFNKTSQKEIIIPCNLPKPVEPVVTLELYPVSITTREYDKIYSFDLTDISTSDYFYEFEVSFNDVPDGEYEYQIGGERGLIRFEPKVEKKIFSILNM